MLGTYSAYLCNFSRMNGQRGAANVTQIWQSVARASRADGACINFQNGPRMQFLFCQMHLALIDAYFLN